MYSIYSDSYLIYDSGIQDYVAMDPKLTLKANEAGQLTFTLPSTNPSISHITRLKSRIKVYRDSTLIFLGRIIEDSVSLDSKHVYVAEGTLAYLLDSVIRPFTAEEVTPAELFAQFLTAHNSQVNVNQQFIQGSCTVTSADTISMTTEDYISPWTAIKTYLVDAYGGYLVITFDSSENPVLSYLADVTDTATQHIEFCENLRSLVVSRNADETYTACIPLGAKQNEIDENSSSEERLTIADANDGLDYLIDSTTAAEYGIIYAPVSITTFPEEKNATYLKQTGLTWLANSGVKLKRSITLTAVDLHNLDKNVEAFSFLDKVVVSCIDICPAETFVLTSMDIPLNNPANTVITLGDETASLVTETAASEALTEARVEKIEGSYVDGTKAAAIANTQIDHNTSILQSAEQIILTALEDYVRTSDYSAFQSSINTTLTVMAGTIEANFSETNSEISEMNGDVSQQFETIRSFIRLISSGIVIGESSSNIKLKLENDILYFFTGDETQVSTTNALAYFSAGKLYVNNVEILTSQKIGPFAWVPDNDNLNFKLMEA